MKVWPKFDESLTTLGALSKLFSNYFKALLRLFWDSFEGLLMCVSDGSLTKVWRKFDESVTTFWWHLIIFLRWWRRSRRFRRSVLQKNSFGALLGAPLKLFWACFALFWVCFDAYLEFVFDESSTAAFLQASRTFLNLLQKRKIRRFSTKKVSPLLFT